MHPEGNMLRPTQPIALCHEIRVIGRYGRTEWSGRTVRKGQCATGKRIFYKERLANRAVSEAAKRGELDPMRHYACPECGYWHLSRKKQPPGRRDNA